MTVASSQIKPRDGVYDAWDVSVRPSVPAIPRFLVPQTILSLVATLQLEAGHLSKWHMQQHGRLPRSLASGLYPLLFWVAKSRQKRILALSRQTCVRQDCKSLFLRQVDTYKKTILPVADSIREFFRWRKPKWMALVLSLLLFRSYVSFEGFLDENSWCHFALEVMSVIRSSVPTMCIR